MMRNPLARLVHRDPAKPTLRERAASLKASLSRLGRRSAADADQGRRAMVAGTLAAALPFPALAGVAQHPDADLIEAGARYDRAIVAEAAANAEYDLAWGPVRDVLDLCPPELVVSYEDRRLILGAGRWPTKVGGYLRFIPRDGGLEEAWTPEVLRCAIRLAVPRLGTGGQTPHHIRRWRGLLPAAEKLEAEYQAACAATGYLAKRKAHRDAHIELSDAAHALREFTASTPEGLAVLVRLVDLDLSRGCNIADRFLPSVAAVVGVDLATLRRPRPGIFN